MDSINYITITSYLLLGLHPFVKVNKVDDERYETGDGDDAVEDVEEAPEVRAAVKKDPQGGHLKEGGVVF